MTGDNKNLILAIVLSVLVIGGYHFLYLAPQAAKQAELARQQAEHAEQAQADADPTARLTAAGQVPGTPQTPELARADAIAATSARQDQVARSRRLDQPHRRRLRRSCTSSNIARRSIRRARLSSCCRPPARPAVISPSRAGFPTAVASQASRYQGAMDRTRRRGAWAGQAGHADLGQWRGRRLQAHDLAERPLSLHDQARDREQDRQCRSACGPMRASSARKCRLLRAGGCSSKACSACSTDARRGSLHRSHRTAQPEKFDSTGGWLGFTDKYWATALIPDQKLGGGRHIPAHQAERPRHLPDRLSGARCDYRAGRRHRDL